MYNFHWTNQFKRDVRKCERRGYKTSVFQAVTEQLIRGQPLPEKFRDHALTGNWRGHRECHLAPDWLLIYRVDEDEDEIEFVRMGSHADLFD